MIFRYDNIRDIIATGKMVYPTSSPTAASWNPTDSGIVVANSTVSNGNYVTGISIDPYNNDRIVVTVGGYGLSTNVYQSTNALSTMTFASMQGNLPHMPCYDVVIDAANTNNVILGTEMGIYATNTNGSSWTQENGGLATVPVFGLRQIPYMYSAGPMLYAATHGRGIFRCGTLITSLNTDNSNHSINSISVYPNPVNNSSAVVKVNLAIKSETAIEVYDYTGKLVLQQNFGSIEKGIHSFNINTTQLASGNYLVSIKTDSGRLSTKMQVIK